MHRTTFVATGLLVLAVAACSSPAAPSSAPATAAAPSGPAASSAPSAAVDTTPVTVRDFTFDQKDITIEGDVSLEVTNAGPTIHNVTIRDDAGTVLGATSDLKEGASETLTVDIPAGTYTFFCSLPGHESLGIKGTLTVIH